MTKRPLSDAAVALLVIAGGLLLYVPFAGSYGLWDPWETHYAEVARQMTHRGDYISLWWPGSPRDADVFWSKPVLSFWLMSLTMRLFGIGLPGNPAGEMALGHRAEWAARLPFCLAGVLGIFAVYLLAQRLVSRRAGLLAAVVVATAPMYSLVARQAMTDMAFVGPMAMALTLCALALFETEDGELPRRGRRWWRWPHDRLFYATVALFAVVVLPQLIVNAVQLRVEVPWGDRVFVMFGAVPMIPYDLGFAAFVFVAARTRRRAPFYLYLAAILCGLAVLAKGLAGLGLPVIVFALFLAFGGGWAQARRARLGFALVGAVIAFAVVAVPWHHAMLIRHGAPFWSELFGDNHWRRMVIGRHGDRGTFEYFLREVGYGIWPWVALAPAAFAWSVLRQPLSSSDAEARKQGARRLGAIWFASAYAVVSVSMTKFHHYVLPAIPGLAIVIGAFADDLLARRAVRTAAATALIGLPLLLLVTLGLADEPHAAEKFLWLFSYDYIQSPTGRPWPAALDFSTALTVFAVLFAAGTLLLAVPRARAAALWTLPLAAVVFTFFVLDDMMPKVAPYWSQKGPIAAYYRLRRSPDERLVAYMLYWRGETFYTSNEIYDGPSEERTVFDQEGADDRLKAWLERHRGRRVFFLFERYQQGRIHEDLPPDARGSFRVVDDFNNKFSLAQADL
ncbi:MAG TPA: glycosyltransferase family 39 protein [Polyangia bacterium]|nr:glycosyltransferase family 39 protein [Polyangia bacterium]